MSALDGFFESYYRLRPVNATFTGVHHHDSRLPDWSPERPGQGGRRHAIDPRDASETPRPMRPSGMSRSGIARSRSPFSTFRWRRSTARTFSVAILLLRSAKRCSASSRSSRVRSRRRRNASSPSKRASRQLPGFLGGARQSIVEGVPDQWRAKCLQECDGATRLLRDGISKWLAFESLSDPRVLQLCEKACARRRRVPALAHHRRAGRRARAARSGAGVLRSALASRSPLRGVRASLAREAGDALDDALALLDSRARLIAPGGYPEVQTRLAKAHPTVANYLSTYQDIWDDCRRASRRADLVTWPAYPIRYVPIPAQTRDAAPLLYYLFYRSPAPFDHLPVHDYVVTPIDDTMPPEEQQRRLRATNISVIKLNHVVHHGAIGHHVQNHYAYSGTSEIGRVAAVDLRQPHRHVPGRHDGRRLGLLRHDLMDEIGFFTADESLAQQPHPRPPAGARRRRHRTSRRHADLRRGGRRLPRTASACRRRRRAARSARIRCFLETAVMYWLGTEGLHRLRRARERAEGTAFSLRRFHDARCRSDRFPVSMLEQIW